MAGLANNLTLRPFKPPDLDQVMHINRVCLPENYPSSFFLNLHQHFPETFIIVEKRKEILGYVMCRVETGLFGPVRMKRGHVVSIAALPKYQRQGIGYALMKEAMQAMRRYGAKECYLEVRATNTPAVEFYKKMGFEITQTFPRYYADGEDAHVLTKKI